MSLVTISWIITAGSILGAIFNARGNVKGFYIWIVANVGWITYNIYIEEYALAALFGVYTFICIYGIWKWKKDKG
ncbi:hypothetical protein LCGC14_0894300 [marine sediment metagenome]|uniref:Nicotinamide mononucleotide transporter PnuC n=1 Tax=marine sediment metagenome TaxID=412755 RepID=A0A0F9NYB8_9ZZZZ